jgi:hypothetical protein
MPTREAGESAARSGAMSARTPSPATSSDIPVTAGRGEDVESSTMKVPAYAGRPAGIQLYSKVNPAFARSFGEAGRRLLWLSNAASCS